MAESRAVIWEHPEPWGVWYRVWIDGVLAGETASPYWLVPADFVGLIEVAAWNSSGQSTRLALQIGPLVPGPSAPRNLRLLA